MSGVGVITDSRMGTYSDLKQALPSKLQEIMAQFLLWPF